MESKSLESKLDCFPPLTYNTFGPKTHSCPPTTPHQYLDLVSDIDTVKPEISSLPVTYWSFHISLNLIRVKWVLPGANEGAVLWGRKRSEVCTCSLTLALPYLLGHPFSSPCSASLLSGWRHAASGSHKCPRWSLPLPCSYSFLLSLLQSVRGS